MGGFAIASTHNTGLTIKLRMDLKVKVELMKNNQLGGPLEDKKFQIAKEPAIEYYKGRRLHIGPRGYKLDFTTTNRKKYITSKLKNLK